VSVSAKINYGIPITAKSVILSIGTPLQDFVARCLLDFLKCQLFCLYTIETFLSNKLFLARLVLKKKKPAAQPQINICRLVLFSNPLSLAGHSL
jgi:hypothetical protein